MKTKILFAILTSMPVYAFAIGAEHCTAFIKQGNMDILKKSSAEHLDAYNYQKYCRDKQYKQSDQIAMAAYGSIFEFAESDMSGSRSEHVERLDKWCSENESSSTQDRQMYSEARLINEVAVNAWESCAFAAAKDLKITLTNVSDDYADMSFTVDSTSDGDMYLTSILQRGYSCEVAYRNMAEASMNNVEAGAFAVRTSDQENIIQEDILIRNANIHVDCERDSSNIKEISGVARLEYEAGKVVINTSGPAFSIFPKSVVEEYISTSKGSVVAFDAPQCPPGWGPYAKASGRTIIGAGTGDNLTARIPGETGGSERHTLTVNEIPSHSHGYRHFTPVHKGGCALAGCNSRVDLPEQQTTRTGGGQPHNNMQPYLALNYCIKQ